MIIDKLKTGPDDLLKSYFHKHHAYKLRITSDLILEIDPGTDSIAWSIVEGAENKGKNYSFGVVNLYKPIINQQQKYTTLIFDRFRNLTKLENDWDFEGGLKPLSINMAAAEQFLLQYGLFIFEEFGWWPPLPEINPVNNGSVDLSWHTKKARMLINIRLLENAPFAFYYGDLYKNVVPTKGNIPIDGILYEHLAQWMKYLNP